MRFHIPNSLRRRLPLRPVAAPARRRMHGRGRRYRRRASRRNRTLGTRTTRVCIYSRVRALRQPSAAQSATPIPHLWRRRRAATVARRGRVSRVRVDPWGVEVGGGAQRVAGASPAPGPTLVEIWCRIEIASCGLVLDVTGIWQHTHGPPHSPRAVVCPHGATTGRTSVQ